MGRPQAAFAARVIASVAVFGVVLWYIEPGAAARHVLSADLRWFALALAANVAAVYASANVLSVLCNGKVTPALVFRVNLKSIYLGTFLPGDVTAGLVSRLRYLGVAWQEVVHRTVVERLVGLATFSAIALAAYAGSSFPGALGPGMLIVPAGVLAAAVLGLVVVRDPAAVVRRFPSLAWVHERFASREPGNAVTLSPLAFAWSAATQACTSLVAYAGMHSVGLPVGLADAIVVGYLLALAQLVPLFFAGIGVRDVSVISLLGSIGVRPETAVAFSTIVLGIILVLATWGGILQVRAESRMKADGR